MTLRTAKRLQFNLGRAEVGLELFRDPDRTVRLLESFDQCGEQSGQGQTRPVKSMGKFVFSVRVFEPKIHPARLKILKVRTARYFEICVLTRGPHFDVVGLG